jgi:hypothetical protein
MIKFISGLMFILVLFGMSLLLITTVGILIGVIFL